MRYAIRNQDLEDSGQHVEPGVYPARIDKVMDKVSSKGNNMMLLFWTIMGTEPPAGTKILENCTMTPESYWRLEDLFTSVGITLDDSGAGFDSQDLIGKEAKIVVVDNEYQGKTRSQVKTHLPM